MHDILMTVLGVTALLGLVSLLLPLAERLSIPYAVLLAVVGIAIGIVASIVGDARHGTVLGDVLGTLSTFHPGAELLVAIFLPPLLFEAALNIDVRQLSDEAGPVLLLAVVAVVLCTFAVGFALWPVWPVPKDALLACIALGAVIATTDPVAVVGIFRDVGAPRRLSTLVEGESLFNDAAAIAIFSVVIGMIETQQGGFLVGIARFLREFLGGLAVGFIAGPLTMRLMPVLRGNRLAEPTLTIASAYIVYVVSDHYLHVSGIVAVAAEAIAISAVGRRRMEPSNWENVVATWEQLAFWAASLIFLLAAMQTPELAQHIHGIGDLGLLAVLTVAAMGARAATLYGLMPILSFARISEPIDNKYKLVMAWGGMRGAVSLALALAALENKNLPPSVAMLATGFVLFTLLVNAPTLRPLMRLIKLNRLSPAEVALRDRVIGLSREAVQKEIEETAHQHQIDPEIAGEVCAIYQQQAGDVAPHGAGELSPELQTRTALVVLADREQEFYSDHFEGRTVSRGGAATLLAHAERLRDRARTEGVPGYRRAAATALSFDRSFHIARAMHRRFGIGGPLSQRLADRFEVLLATRSVVQKLATFNHEQIGALFGERARDELAALIDERLARIERAIAALKLQYPSYARQLETHFLARTAARAEDERYAQLREESIVNRDVYDDLQRDLLRRRRVLEVRPTLDLGLDREQLIARVPLFATCDREATVQVARLLRPRLAVPDETLVRKGDRGDAMYFVSSGAVEVRIQPEPVQLGTGEFFGEMALIVADRRNADVVALCYCDLLTLDARDLDELFLAHPAIGRQIEAVARERRGAVAASPA